MQGIVWSSLDMWQQQKAGNWRSGSWELSSNRFSLETSSNEANEAAKLLG